DGRGGERQPGPRDERLRADRLPGRDVLLDDAEEELPLAPAELRAHPSMVGGRLAYALREQRRRDGVAEEAAAVGQGELAALAPDEPEPLDALQPRRVERLLDPRERQRLVEAQGEHDPLRRARRRQKLLRLAERPLPVREGADVVGE